MSFDLQSFHSLYRLSNTSLVDQCIALLTNQWGGSYDSRLHYLLDNNKLKYDSIRNNGLIHDDDDDEHDDSIDHHDRYHDHDHDHHISRSCSWILLDHKSNLVVGHVRMSPMRQNTSNDLNGSALSCILTSIVIHSDYRSQGIGRYLMNRIEQIAITTGYYHIYLWTTDAIDFYRKLNYHVCDNYGLSSNVSVFDYISTKRLNSIENLLLKRLSAIQHNNYNSSESYNDAIDHSNSVDAVTYDNDSQDHSGKSIVWLRKRIKDMCPFIFIPDITLKTYITDNFHKQYHHHHRQHLGDHQQNQQSDDGIYHSSLQSSYSSSSNAFIHMIHDPQQGRFGIHWSQQVGPSCGIQAIRFAIDILLPSLPQSYSSTELKVEQPDMLSSFQLIHDNNNHKSLEINKNKNKATTCSDQFGPHFTISIPSSSLSSSAVAVADPSLPSPQSASTTFVNEQEMSHNFLQEAIQLEYTTEGAIYNLHHIVDLIQRYSCSTTFSSRSTSPSHNHSHGHYYGHGDGHGGNGVDRIKAKMMSVKESIKRPRDLCDLLMCHNNYNYKSYNDLRYPRKVITTNIMDSTEEYTHHHHHHRGVLIFPYDRDECMSEPCNKGGSKAHYALIIGYIIINNEEKMMKKKEMMRGEKQYGSFTVDCSTTTTTTTTSTTTTTLDPYSSSVNYAMVNSVDYDKNSKSSYCNSLDITAACTDDDDDNDENSDNSVAINDLDIDDDIYLIGIHGLSKHPIVAPYRKWIASNQQLNDKSHLSTTGVSYMDNSKYNNDIYSVNLNKHSDNNLAGNFVYVSV